MKLEEFISIVSSLNGGIVISGVANDDTEIPLGESAIRLYCANHKYYFLAEYQDDYDVIERKIKSNQFLTDIKERRPNNSYLILIYKIEQFDVDVSKKIIALEENEFFYKRYVFYYTEEEYKSFINWFNNKPDKTLTDILKTENCSPESANLYMQFLLRMVIKVPFINLEFKKMELDNFDDLVTAQLNGLRKNKIEVLALFNRLTDEFEKHSVDEIVETLFSEIIGGVDNENQIN